MVRASAAMAFPKSRGMGYGLMDAFPFFNGQCNLVPGPMLNPEMALRCLECVLPSRLLAVPFNEKVERILHARDSGWSLRADANAAECIMKAESYFTG